jgi:hypothetical protein
MGCGAGKEDRREVAAATRKFGAQISEKDIQHW